MADQNRGGTHGGGGYPESQGGSTPGNGGTSQRGGNNPQNDPSKDEPRRGGGRIGEVQDRQQPGQAASEEQDWQRKEEERRWGGSSGNKPGRDDAPGGSPSRDAE